MRTFSSLKKLLWCGSAVAAMALAGTAQAQTAQPTPTPTPSDVAAAPATNANAPTPPSENEQIVVTGSRVIRDGYQAPTPLTVVTREDIQNTAPTNNIADLVNQLPALAGSTRPSNSRLELSSGIGGVNTLNLRNLGTVRTLSKPCTKVYCTESYGNAPLTSNAIASPPAIQPASCSSWMP